MKKRIEYHTAYDDRANICGYVIAEDKGSYYTINKRQYNGCLRNRTIGGNAGVIFHTNKPVMVTGINIF